MGSLNDLSKNIVLLLTTMDQIYFENYTNFPKKQFLNFESLFDMPVKLVSREMLETNSKSFLLQQKNTRSALLISGDPFIATTHYMLFLEAISLGLNVEIYNNLSIISLAPSLSGLSAYKFGKTVTLPFQERIESDTPYLIVQANTSIQAHTLVLLDIDVLNNIFVSVSQAIDRLIQLEVKYNNNVITDDTIVIGLSNLGNKDTRIHAGKLKDILQLPWSSFGPPQALIVCSKLQITEEEVMNSLWIDNGIHPIIHQPVTKILVTGTFDILHPGHLQFFSKVRSLASSSELWVVVARDSSVQEFKKRAPILSENYRKKMLQSIKLVDHVILGNEGKDKLKIVEEIRPDILALGYDQWINPVTLQEELIKRGLHTKVIQMEKYGDSDYSSSTFIREKIIKNNHRI